jgi:hypothetical protein
MASKSSYGGKHVEKGNYSKTIAMIFFLLVDLGFNSSLDYDSYNGKFNTNVLLALVFVQLVIQIVIFLVLFLTMVSWPVSDIII